MGSACCAGDAGLCRLCHSHNRTRHCTWWLLQVHVFPSSWRWLVPAGTHSSAPAPPELGKPSQPHFSFSVLQSCRLMRKALKILWASRHSDKCPPAGAGAISVPDMSRAGHSLFSSVPSEWLCCDLLQLNALTCTSLLPPAPPARSAGTGLGHPHPHTRTKEGTAPQGQTQARSLLRPFPIRMIQRARASC